MTRLLALAALLAACALASSETALAAKGGFKGGFKPVPFRAHGLFAPGHAADALAQRPAREIPRPSQEARRAAGHRRPHRRRPRAAQSRVRSPSCAPDEAIVRPAIVPVGGTVGCAIEDIGVAGGRTVSIIRC